MGGPEALGLCEVFTAPHRKNWICYEMCEADTQFLACVQSSFHIIPSIPVVSLSPFSSSKYKVISSKYILRFPFNPLSKYRCPVFFGTLRLFVMTTNLFVIANVKQLRTYVVLECYCLFSEHLALLAS